MASVNKVQIIGNLGRDPEIKYLPSGDALANIAVATSYKSKDKNTGEQTEKTEWHRISFFGKLAEIVGQYLKKGSSVYVEGRLQTRKYTDKDGVEKYATEIVAENMQMLGGRADGGGQSAPAPQQRPAPAATRPGPRPAPSFPDDDIPFTVNATDINDTAGHSKGQLRARYGRVPLYHAIEVEPWSRRP